MHVKAVLIAAVAVAAGTVVASPAYAATPHYRQLVGHASGPEYLEASVPSTGRYTVEYDVTGVAFFDTYVDGKELGYVGGSTGAYHTRTITLTAGGHLLQVAGPEGTGHADIYLDSAS